MPSFRNFTVFLIIVGYIFTLGIQSGISYPLDDRKNKFDILKTSTIGQCLDAGYDIVDNQILEIRNSLEMKFMFVCTNGIFYEQVYSDTSDIVLTGGRFTQDDPEGRLVYLWAYRSATTGRAIDLEFHLYRVVLTGMDPPGGSGGVVGIFRKNL
ncbi:MAG: hypothetical protein D6732_21100 [Methanobacteriota archaeon]|nr:MAG: hypothetical protein D6732_21100 [Euryarchaeota archaeon]